MIYQSKSKKEARKHYDDFIHRYEARYPKAVNILRNCPSLFTFYLFPEQIRRSIYTSNLIEAFNKQLKRDIKKKEQFPNEESLERFTCVKVIDINSRSARKAMRGFIEAAYELNQLFENTYGTESEEFTQNS
jgi:transposase-like protein